MGQWLAPTGLLNPRLWVMIHKLEPANSLNLQLNGVQLVPVNGFNQTSMRTAAQRLCLPCHPLDPHRQTHHLRVTIRHNPSIRTLQTRPQGRLVKGPRNLRILHHIKTRSGLTRQRNFGKAAWTHPVTIYGPSGVWCPTLKT